MICPLDPSGRIPATGSSWGYPLSGYIQSIRQHIREPMQDVSLLFLYLIDHHEDEESRQIQNRNAKQAVCVRVRTEKRNGKTVTKIDKTQENGADEVRHAGQSEERGKDADRD